MYSAGTGPQLPEQDDDQQPVGRVRAEPGVAAQRPAVTAVHRAHQQLYGLFACAPGVYLYHLSHIRN